MALAPPSEPNQADDIDSASVGEQLSLAAVHLRGLHFVVHPDCWRCRSAGREQPGDLDAAEAAT